MTGYWRLPEETQRVLGADGWLRTGDAGFLDEDGYLHIRDRIKDMIVSGGENVYCVEIEDALLAHPDIFEAAIVGIPDSVLGELVGSEFVYEQELYPEAVYAFKHPLTQEVAYG